MSQAEAGAQVLVWCFVILVVGYIASSGPSKLVWAVGAVLVLVVAAVLAMLPVTGLY